MLSVLRRHQQRKRNVPYYSPYAAEQHQQQHQQPMPVGAPIEQLAHDFSDTERDNIADEISQLMAKRYPVEKNLARTSMYKHFTDESLYHGVNLNAPEVHQQQPHSRRCSCGELSANYASSIGSDSEDSIDIGLLSLPKYSFTHRNLMLSFEDQENLENEAMEVYTNFGYETSF